MATLTKNGEEYRHGPLVAKLNLRDMEHPEDPEGWINYSSELKIGDHVLASTVGTIHDVDVRWLVQELHEAAKKKFTFEPTEPDFHISGEPTQTHDVLLDWHIDVSTFYDGSGVGFRAYIDYHTIQRFADQLEAELKEITSGKLYEF